MNSNLLVTTNSKGTNSVSGFAEDGLLISELLKNLPDWISKCMNRVVQ